MSYLNKMNEFFFLRGKIMMHLTKLMILHLKMVSFKYCNDIYFLSNFGSVHTFSLSSNSSVVPHPSSYLYAMYTYIEITKMFMLKTLSQLNA